MSEWTGGKPSCSHSGARDVCFCGAERKVAPDADDFLVRLDPGIREAVRILMAGGVETYESCEGGLHHAFHEPTVRFHGERGEGLKALSLAIVHELPVQALRRIWTMIDGEPTGPHWEMVFSKKVAGPGHMSPRSEGGQDIGAASADAPDTGTDHPFPVAAPATCAEERAIRRFAERYAGGVPTPEPPLDWFNPATWLPENRLADALPATQPESVENILLRVRNLFATNQENHHLLHEALRLYRSEHEKNDKLVARLREGCRAREERIASLLGEQARDDIKITALQAEREEWQSQLAVANAMVDGLKAERDDQLRRLDAARRHIEKIEGPTPDGTPFVGRSVEDALTLMRKDIEAANLPYGQGWAGRICGILARVRSMRSAHAREMHDYEFVLNQVPKVYMAVTGNKMSKVNYYAEDVIREFEAYVDERVKEAVAEEVTSVQAERDEANRQFAAWKLTAEKFQGERDKARERLEAAVGHLNRVGAERDRAWVAIKQGLDHARRLIRMMSAHPDKPFPCKECDAEAGHIVAALRDGGQP